MQAAWDKRKICSTSSFSQRQQARKKMCTSTNKMQFCLLFMALHVPGPHIGVYYFYNIFFFVFFIYFFGLNTHSVETMYSNGFCQKTGPTQFVQAKPYPMPISPTVFWMEIMDKENNTYLLLQLADPLKQNVFITLR